VSPRREHSELVKSTWAQGLPLCLLLVGGEGSAVWKAAGAHNSCTIEQEENGYLLSLSSRSDPHQLSKQPRALHRSTVFPLAWRNEQVSIDKNSFSQ
jgi:hypothetical protein